MCRHTYLLLKSQLSEVGVSKSVNNISSESFTGVLPRHMCISDQGSREQALTVTSASDGKHRIQPYFDMPWTNKEKKPAPKGQVAKRWLVIDSPDTAMSAISGFRPDSQVHCSYSGWLFLQQSRLSISLGRSPTLPKHAETRSSSGIYSQLCGKPKHQLTITC